MATKHIYVRKGEEATYNKVAELMVKNRVPGVLNADGEVVISIVVLQALRSYLERYDEPAADDESELSAPRHKPAPLLALEPTG